MRRIPFSLALAGLLALAACSSDDADLASGSLSVLTTAHSDIATSVTSVTLTLSPSGATRTLTEWDEDTVAQLFAGVPVGETTINAEAHGEGGLLAAAAVTTTVAEGKTARALLRLAPSGFRIQGLAASNESPDTSETVNLTVAMENAPEAVVQYDWDDDCQGGFSNAEGPGADWRNLWEETCTITVTASFAGAMDTAEMQLESRYAKGTAMRFAGTSCSYATGQWDLGGPLVGEGGPADQASFGNPFGVAVGPDGNVYFTDREGGRVLMVDDEGILHRVAGTVAGSHTSSGDGGPALEAELYWPLGLTLDPAGNLYFSDGWQSGVRRIDAATGEIATVTTNGNPIGLTANAEGDIFYGAWESVERYYAATETTQTLSTDSSKAFGVALQADGTLLVADRNEHQVWSMHPVSGAYEVFAGTGVAGYAGDNGLATDAEFKEPYDVKIAPSGDVYILDGHNARVRRVDSSGIVTTVVGPGLNPGPGDAEPLAAPIGTPSSIAFDADGNLYVGNRKGCVVHKVVGPF